MTFNQKTIYVLIIFTLVFLAAFMQFILLTCFSAVVLLFFGYQEIKLIKNDIAVHERLQMIDQKITALEIKNQGLSLAIGFRK